MASERCPCCETCACCGCNAADLRARLALAEAVIEAARPARAYVAVRLGAGLHAQETLDQLDATLQAFDRAANPETQRGTPAPECNCGRNYKLCPVHER